MGSLPSLSPQDARQKVLAGEPIQGYHIDSFDLTGLQLKEPLCLENCEIDLLDLSGSRIEGVASFNDTTFSKLVLGWKSPFHKTPPAVFNSAVTFNKCLFQGEALFGGAEFFGIISFREAVFHKPAIFRESFFHEQVYFWKAYFGDETSFRGCRFGIEGYFDNSEFIRNVDFENAVFHQKEASFNNIHAYGNMNFMDARIECFLALRKAIVDGELDFKNATFEEADFSDAQLKSKVSFRGAQFHQNAIFIHTIFQGLASFLGTQFQKVQFLNSQFHDEALFNYDRNTRFSLQDQGSEAQFFGDADFTNVRFHKRTVFEKVIFHKNATFANCYFGEQATFSETECKFVASFDSVYGNQEFSASKAVFVDVTFNYANINRRLDLSDAQWKSISFYKAALDLMVVEKSQIRKKLDSEKPSAPIYANAKEEYLLLKESFQKRGLHQEEDWAYRKFRQLRRKASSQAARQSATGKHGLRFMVRSLVRLAWNLVERIIVDRGTGYGTQPLNITIVAFSIILLFASIYAQFPNGLNYAKQYDFGFSQAIYFSFATFTTMGFGDIQPRLDSIMRFVVSAEAFIGLFIMTLFVGTYTRKIIR